MKLSTYGWWYAMPKSEFNYRACVDDGTFGSMQNDVMAEFQVHA